MKPTLFMALKVWCSLTWGLGWRLLLIAAILSITLGMLTGFFSFLFIKIHITALTSTLLNTSSFILISILLFYYFHFFAIVFNKLPDISYEGFRVQFMKDHRRVDKFDRFDSLFMVWHLTWRGLACSAPFLLLWTIVDVPAFLKLLVELPLPTLAMWWFLSMKDTKRWILLEKVQQS